MVGCRCGSEERARPKSADFQAMLSRFHCMGLRRERGADMVFVFEFICSIDLFEFVNKLRGWCSRPLYQKTAVLTRILRGDDGWRGIYLPA